MALHDDLGGAPAIAAALDRFYPKLLADPKLSPFFAGVNIDKRTRLDFLCKRCNLRLPVWIWSKQA